MLKILNTFILFILTTNCFGQKFSICYENNEQFPYYLGESNVVPTEKQGVSIDIIKEAVSPFNFDIEFIRAPWSRCLNLLQEGKVDLTFNSSFKKSRKKFGRYPENNGKVDVSRRIMSLSYSLYVKQDSELKWDGKDFTNLEGPIGAQRGFSIVDKLKKLGAVVEEADNTKTNFKKLLNKRLDAVAAQTVTGDSILRRNKEYQSKIKKVKNPLVEKPYYVMLSHQFVKNNPEISERIWDNIGKIREASLEKYLERYNL